MKRGSPATSLGKLPGPLVPNLPGFGLRVLVGVLEALASGTPSRLLSAALQLCLTKKLPAWLVRNNRPVMLEPWLRRLETGVVQDLRVTRRQLRRALPPKHFAYQRQMSGQSLAVACRWLLAGRAIQQIEVWSDDWDEANAFCDPDGEAAVAGVHEAPGESLSLWLYNPRFVVWPLELGLGTGIPRFVAWPLELGLGTRNPHLVVWPLELGLGTHNPRFDAWPLELGLGTHNPRFVAWPLELGLGTPNARFVAWPLEFVLGVHNARVVV